MRATRCGANARATFHRPLEGRSEPRPGAAPGAGLLSTGTSLERRAPSLTRAGARVPAAPQGGSGRLSRFSEPLGLLEIDRDEPRDAALGHGDAVEAVHARHRHAVMRDDEEAR